MNKALRIAYLSALSALLMVCCIPYAAHAAINKCVGADGKVVFSDQPCTTGQSATSIKGTAKPSDANQSAKPKQAPTAADLPSEGKATPNSNLQQYDSLCAEDRRLLAIAQTRVVDSLSNQNHQLTVTRVNKRCNPEARLLAAEKDVEGQAISCKFMREELESLKRSPPLPAGYASRAPDIAQKESWLKANCN